MIQNDFYWFDTQNPHVYQLFKQVALELVGTDIKRIGAKFIWEIMRYKIYFEVKKSEREKYKLNNNYTALYARKFVTDFPQFKDKFEFRAI